MSESIPFTGTAAPKTVHGLPDGHEPADPAAVVNDHEYDAIAFPARSFTPDTTTEYCVEAANAADGVNVTTVPAPFNPVDPATAEPPCGVTVIDAPAWIGSLNVTDTADDVATPDAPNPGTVDTTLGGVVSAAADVVNTTSTQ